MAVADLLLHPVRLRIVRAFLGDRALTTGALAAELADVPPATLYRQVARLVDAGVLQVFAEQPIRGGVQRTYMLRASAALITPDQVAALSRDDLRQAFLVFVAGLLGDVDRYLARDTVDPTRDGASFRLAGLWLDDAELAALLAELVRVLRPAAANLPRPGRKRRILATVLLPGDEAGPSPGAAPNSGGSGGPGPAGGARPAAISGGSGGSDAAGGARPAPAFGGSGGPGPAGGARPAAISGGSGGPGPAGDARLSPGVAPRSGGLARPDAAGGARPAPTSGGFGGRGAVGGAVSAVGGTRLACGAGFTSGAGRRSSGRDVRDPSRRAS